RYARHVRGLDEYGSLPAGPSRGTAAGPGGAAGVSTTVGSWTGQGATSVRSSWNDRGAGTVGGVATAIPPASPLPGAAR
ncbi:hypothetical protein ACWD6V_39950, partial [Streptomyces sp. NPDC005125]